MTIQEVPTQFNRITDPDSLPDERSQALYRALSRDARVTGSDAHAKDQWSKFIVGHKLQDRYAAKQKELLPVLSGQDLKARETARAELDKFARDLWGEAKPVPPTPEQRETQSLARGQIAGLKLDPNYQAALWDSNHPAHKDAVLHKMALHAAAIGGEPVDSVNIDQTFEEAGFRHDHP